MATCHRPYNAALHATIIIISIVAFTLLLLPPMGRTFADPLQNAYQQRIGNYDFEMVTEPRNPVAGSPTQILLRIAGVNGDDLVDVPILIRIVDYKAGTMLQETNPIVVPYGHYTHEYTFAEPGRYVVYIDLNDYSYSGETLTFTFFVNVSGPFDYFYIVILSAAGAAAAIAGGAMILRKMRRKRQMDTQERSLK